MAAGLGFKTFTTGEVLTAADVNGYLMQGILVFANAAARTSAITSPQEGQYSFLKDTNALEYYDGAAWVGAPVGDITAVTAGTGISGGGSSGAVTITNDMATTITASGDIVVGTGNGTYDNLPIGSTGQVLTADTTVSPYKVKWATAAGGGDFVKVTSGTFSNQSSFAIDNCFNSTYQDYFVILEAKSANNTGSDDLQLQFRYSSTTETSANYYGSLLQQDRANVITNAGFVGATQATLSANVGQTGYETKLTMYFKQVGNSSEKPTYWGTGLMSSDEQAFGIFAGICDTAQTFTGFLLKTSSSNITGSYAVWGLKR